MYSLEFTDDIIPAGDEIQKVAEGYQRAAAMINDELRYIDVYNVVPYNVTD
nr:MAG TPA: Polymyxin resistance protein PmrD [Caudoviricetes sp.]